MTKEDIICVVGLGYVGLPLAVAFAKRGFKVIGFDIKETRIKELKEGKDRTNEVKDKDLDNDNLFFTSDPSKIKDSDFVIIAVPTPITINKKPDLSYLKKASEIVGSNLQKGGLVVYESTVYPGVTEEVCAPILEKSSGMKCGKDFKIGYSPERINPGDEEHTVNKIIKVVSGIDKESRDKIANTYSRVVDAGVFKAKNIKTAEAAKVIENVQRDLNIALMNELSIIFSKLGINTKDVLKAAETKWNFHKYVPGLVGGHCIMVDPYYLTFKALELGYNPKVILAGRDINDSMSRYVVEKTIQSINSTGKLLNRAKVALLGLTFKENVPDIRNSKAKDIIYYLKEWGIEVLGIDPLIENALIENLGAKPVKLDDLKDVDCVILNVIHNKFKSLDLKCLSKLMDKPIVIDIKSFFDKDEADREGIIYFSL